MERLERWRAVLKENLEIAALVATALVAIVTIVGAVVGSARWLKAGIDAEIAEVRQDLAQVRHDLEAQIAEVKQELKVEIAEVRQELKAEIAEVRQELKAEIAQVKQDLEDQIAGLATGTEWRIDTSAGSLQQQIVGLREQLNGMQQQITALQEQLALIALRLPARESGGTPELGRSGGDAQE